MNTVKTIDTVGELKKALANYSDDLLLEFTLKGINLILHNDIKVNEIGSHLEISLVREY